MPGTMGIALENKGGLYWHISERAGKRLNMSKASLGLFCFEVMRGGGEIIQLWPFAPQYDRSAVYPIVAMTQAQRDKFEADTGFVLVTPPKVHLNKAD